MSLGSYVLARFNDAEKLLPAMRTVQSCEPVERWHAVDGHVHLVMKISSPASALPDAITHLDGVEAMYRYDIVQDGEKHKPVDPAMAHAYVFLEIEIVKLDKVRATLAAMPEVLFCTTTHGGCDLVALVSGGSFDAIEHTINDKVRMLDGLLRLKANYVIELTKL